MNEHGQLEYATAGGNDYVGHEQMYRTFVTLRRRRGDRRDPDPDGDFPHLKAEPRDDGEGCRLRSGRYRA